MRSFIENRRCWSETFGDQRIQIYRANAEYLSSINLSGRERWRYELNTAPERKRAPRVIYTEYDVPRDTISSQDVIVDGDGMVWYSSFGEQKAREVRGDRIGTFDTKTEQFKEWVMRRGGRRLMMLSSIRTKSRGPAQR